MQVSGVNGVAVHEGDRALFLDPKRRTDACIVTHGHTDHLMGGARGASPTSTPWMTPPTLDFLRIRKPARSGHALPYGKDAEVGGFTVRLHDAGHVLGSAMVEVDTDEGAVIYTGDFNPRAGFASPGAQARACHTLVTESTYGDPRFDLPPRDMVLGSLEAWVLARLLKGPVALGAYPLGRAQELVHIANRAGITPIVSPEIGALTAVYNAHGHDLSYAVEGTSRAADLDASGGLHIVSRDWLKRDHPFVRGLRERGGHAGYLSGWCHRYSYFNAYDIDAQFALSDHAGFREIVAFAQACQPKRVYTMHGAADALARELRKVGLDASPL